MPPSKTAITHHTTQAAAPAYRLNDNLLDLVMSALPPMSANAPLVWQQMRRARIAAEIAALHPTDAAQAHLAGQAVLMRHMAADTMSRAARPGHTPALARRLDRTAAALLRTSKQMALALRRRQRIVAPRRAVARWGKFDLLALDAAWCGGAAQIDAVAEWQEPDEDRDTLEGPAAAVRGAGA